MLRNSQGFPFQGKLSRSVATRLMRSEAVHIAQPSVDRIALKA